MAGSILGTAVRRFEDPELLTGQATFIDNLRLPNLAVATFVRSPLAHGLIRSIDTVAAAAMPGVFGIFTAADLGLAPQAIFIQVAEVFDRPPLATDRVRFVGEPVAIIVAATKAQAYDAAEAVVVDYEPLGVVVDPEDAFAADAPILFPEHGSNLSFSVADPVGEDFFADAEVVVRGRFVNQRIAVAPMEPNAFAAVPQPDGRLLAYASTQMPHVMHPMLAAAVGLALEQVQVIAPHVGGGFGGKAGSYTEYSVVAAAALRLGRPVSWVETRSEDFVALVHSRAQVQYVELGCRADGTFTGLRARIVGDSGAYPGVGTMLPAGTRRMSQGVYNLPKLGVEVACATTNTTQTGAYRGAGRPEAASMVERIVDMAALQLGIDPAEIRRRNFLSPDQFPYDTLTGITYDSGDYDVPLTKVLGLAGYDDLRAEQAARRRRGDGKLLGIGLSTYVEITAGGANGSEFGAVEVHADGSATVRCGTSAHGQGHATSFAMIVADRLGIPMERVRLVQSDTDLVRTGGGTGGSRSLQLGGSAVLNAAEAVLAKAKRLAAHLLEAAEQDMVIGEDGRVGVAGVPSRALSWAELAVAAADPANGTFLGRADEDRRGPALAPLSAQLDFAQAGPTFPFGAHIAVVEVDRETGRVELLRHIAVDDCGTVINPLLVAGQQHGGVASGIAQALYEHMVYDAEGNPLTTNFADYAIPSAAEFPSFEVFSTQTPTPNNPLGAKGIGEAGTIGATPAVQNAVVDALAHLGVRHLDMPLTPETVWRALVAAEAGSLPDPWSEPPAVFATLIPTLVDVNKLADEADV